MNSPNILLKNNLRTAARSFSYAIAIKKPTQKSHFCAQKSHFPLTSTARLRPQPVSTAPKVDQDTTGRHSSLIDQDQHHRAAAALNLCIPGSAITNSYNRNLGRLYGV